MTDTTDQPAVTVAQIEAEARRYAAMYPEGSDGRNTFVMFADMVTRLASVSSASAEGFVMVPREMTDEMASAVVAELTAQRAYLGWEPTAIYRAALSAVPATNQAGEVERGMSNPASAWLVDLAADNPAGDLAALIAVAEDLWHVMRHAPDCGRGCTCYYEPLAKRMRALLPFRMEHRTLATQPATSQEGEVYSREWCLNMAAHEGNAEIGAGSLDHPLRLAALATQPATSPCADCKGTGYSGGVIPSEPELCDACETCFGEGVRPQPATSQEGEGQAFRPMETWDCRDEIVMLLVDYREDGDHALDDADIAITVGHNNDHNVGEGEGRGWQFAGWCWTHDHYVEGKGKPVGWMPLPHHLVKGFSL